MILRRSNVLFILLLYFIRSQGFHYMTQSENDDDESEKLGVLRSYLERNAEPRSIFRSYNRQFVKPKPAYGIEERDTGDIAHTRTFEPEEKEIDAIGKKFILSDDTIPPQSNSQPETVPLVVQKLTENSSKQARIPQTKDVVNSPLAHKSEIRPSNKASDIYFIALVAGCSGAAVFGVITAGFCWYKLQKNAKAAAAADYPAYGVTGPSKEDDMTSLPSGDRKLAQNAQMYHYQHQKQQMIAIEKANGDRHVSTSDLDSEEENEDGDYTVYECAGLAPTGEMEVKNPLFQDEPPAPPSPPIITKELEK